MKASFFKRNRQLFAQHLDGKVCVLTAYGLQQQHNDTAFAFRQESNFYYLTGINEPNWLLVIDAEVGEEYLVAPKIDATHAVFEGELSAPEATSKSGITKVLSRNDLPGLLDRLSTKHQSVTSLGAHPWKKNFNFSQNVAQSRLNTILKQYFVKIEDCRLVLAKQRAIKQPEEIVQIQRAIDVTAQALEHVQHRLADLSHEYEVEAEIGYHFRASGLSHAYQPIVAGGRNACTLHYQQNSQPLDQDILVLLDVGAQSEGYAADISRTYAYGQPSQYQIAIHHAVEQAHRQIIALLKPGLKIKDYLEQVDEIMKTALNKLGLIEGKEDVRYRNYFPHAVSHGLGLDVHESLGGYEVFMAGMVLTVEPGIYIAEEGIGVRIEDDILITADGHKNLSAAISTDLTLSSIINE